MWGKDCNFLECVHNSEVGEVKLFQSFDDYNLVGYSSDNGYFEVLSNCADSAQFLDGLRLNHTRDSRVRSDFMNASSLITTLYDRDDKKYVIQFLLHHLRLNTWVVDTLLQFEDFSSVVFAINKYLDQLREGRSVIDLSLGEFVDHDRFDLDVCSMASSVSADFLEFVSVEILKIFNRFDFKERFILTHLDVVFSALDHFLLKQLPRNVGVLSPKVLVYRFGPFLQPYLLDKQIDGVVDLSSVMVHVDEQVIYDLVSKIFDSGRHMAVNSLDYIAIKKFLKVCYPRLVVCELQIPSSSPFDYGEFPVVNIPKKRFLTSCELVGWLFPKPRLKT
jgi:hypothetical protein